MAKLIGPLSIHTLVPLIPPLLEPLAESFFSIFRSSAVEFDLILSMYVKCVPLRSSFRVMNSQNLLEARSGEYDVWVTTGMFFSTRNYTTSSNGMARWITVVSYLGTNFSLLCLICTSKDRIAGMDS